MTQDLPTYKRIDALKIKPYDKNSRTHSDDQVEQICKSIREFGFTNPLIIDLDYNLIAGHARLLAAQKLNITVLPCIFLENLSEAQRKAYVIADNKLALNAGWDNDFLIEELRFLDDADYDITLTGFSRDELDIFLAPPVEPLDGSEDDLPEEDVIEPRVKLGDVWSLGEHILVCGDCTHADIVSALLDKTNVNLMITDPPYGIKLDMSKRGDTKRRKTNNKNTILNDDRADWYDAYSLFTGSIAYVWHASIFSDVVMNDLRKSGFDIKQQLIWNKSHFNLGRSNYHWKHEPCWYAVRQDCKSNWVGDRTQSTVWDISAPNQSATKSIDDKTRHPTQKAVELYTKAILNHTKTNDYIYDPFGGSGTAIIAAQKINRRALSIELDPKYCDMILKRWENITHKLALLRG